MKKLAPEIYRQRLIIEGYYSIEINKEILESFMHKFSKEIGMTIILGPLVINQAEKVNPIHQGFESVIIWAESGTTIYTWEKQKFFTADIYSCKQFDTKLVINFFKENFTTTEIVFKEI